MFKRCLLRMDIKKSKIAKNVNKRNETMEFMPKEFSKQALLEIKNSQTLASCRKYQIFRMKNQQW